MGNEVEDIILNEMTGNNSSTGSAAATTATTTDTTTTATAEVATTDTAQTDETELREVAIAPASTDTAKPEETTSAPIVLSFEDQLKELGFQSKDELLSAKAELEQLKSRNTLGTTLDKLTATGVSAETVLVYHKLDLEAKDGATGAYKVPDRAVLDLQMQLKYPTLTSDQRTAMLDKKYGSQDPEDPSYDIAGQGQQTIDSNAARQDLMTEKAKILDVKQAAESFESTKGKEFEVAENARVKEWHENPKIKEIATNLKTIGQKISFPIFGEDNKPVSKAFEFTHKVDATDVAKIENSLRVMAINNGLDPKDPKAIESLQTTAANIYKLQNFDKIMSDVAARVSSHLYKNVSKTYHGAQETGVTRSAGGGAKDTHEQRAEASIAAM